MDRGQKEGRAAEDKSLCQKRVLIGPNNTSVEERKGGVIAERGSQNNSSVLTLWRGASILVWTR